MFSIDPKTLNDVDDLISSIRDHFPKYHLRAVRSALASEAFRLKGLTQQEIESQGQGKWKKKNPASDHMSGKSFRLTHPLNRKWVKNYRLKTKNIRDGAKSRSKKIREFYPWLSKRPKNADQTPALPRIWKALRYEKQWLKNGKDQVEFGFFPAKRAKWLPGVAAYHDTAHRIPISEKSRKRMFALGVPLKKSTHFLKIPARPSLSTVYFKEKKTIPANFKTKYINSILRYWGKGSKGFSGIYKDETPIYERV